MDSIEEKDEFDPAVATVKGTFWAYASHISGKGMSFIATIILARLLAKEDFGVAAYAVVTLNFLDMMNGMGIESAIIFHKSDYRRTNTAFWIGVITSWMVCGLSYMIAPTVALVFKDPRAVGVIRLLALTYPLSALYNVHDALLRKQLKFGRKLIPDFFRAASKGVFSIIFATMGFGAWSLIYGPIVGAALAVIPYWRLCRFRPSLQFDRMYVPELMSYGIKMVAVNALAVISLNIDYLFVGRFLGPAALGVYTVAFRIPELLIKEFCTMIGKVIFPVYTRIRDQVGALSTAFVSTMRYVVTITLPVGAGLFLLAQPFVQVVFSHKWLDAVPVMQAIAVLSVLRSLTFNAGDAYKAQGRMGQLTKLSLLQVAINVPLLYWTVQYFHTMGSVAWAQAFVAFFTGALKMYAAARILKVPFRNVISAIMPALFATSIMCAAIGLILIVSTNAPPVIRLVSGVITGVTTYMAAMWWLRPDMVLTARQTLRSAFLQRT